MSESDIIFCDAKIKSEPVVSTCAKISTSNLIQTVKFKKSGMVPGSLEKYLVQPSPHNDRPESPDPDIEIIAEIPKKSEHRLDTHDPKRVYSTPPPNRPATPEIEIIFVKEAKTSPRPRNDPIFSPEQLACRKNLNFKTEETSSIIIVSAKSLAEVAPPVLEPEPPVITRHSTNLPPNETIGEQEPIQASDAQNDPKEMVAPEVPKKMLVVQFNLSNPAHKRRSVLLEEKENGIQATDTVGITSVPDKDVSKAITLSKPPEKKRGFVGKENDKQTETRKDGSSKVTRGSIDASIVSNSSNSSNANPVRKYNLRNPSPSKCKPIPSPKQVERLSNPVDKIISAQNGPINPSRPESSAQARKRKLSGPQNHLLVGTEGANKKMKSAQSSGHEVIQNSNNSSNVGLNTHSPACKSVIKRRESSSSAEMLGTPAGTPTKDNRGYDILWGKKMYKEILLRLAKDAEQKKFPREQITANIILECVLCLSGRISKEVSGLAIEFFQHLTEISNSRKYFWDVFDHISKVLLMTNDRLVDLLLVSLKGEVKLKSEEKLTLRFFQVLNYLLEKDYEQYKTQFRLRQPLLVQMMLDDQSTYAVNYNENWSHFIQSIKNFPAQTEEAKIIMKWIDLMACHYMDKGVASWGQDGLEKLKEELVTNINERQDKDYGFQYLKHLSKTEFSLSVSMTLFQDNLPKLDPLPPAESWPTILRELSANMNCPRTCELNSFQRQFEEGSELAALHEFATGKVNSKGETNIHLACGGKKIRAFCHGNSRKEYSARSLLRDMYSKKFGDINVTDNNGNTPLHEACYHGNLPVITTMWEKFVNPDSLPGPFNIDILAQNGCGETSLHLAIKEGHYDCVDNLLIIATVLKKDIKVRLIRTRNYQGKTAYDFLPARGDHHLEELKSKLRPGSIRKHYGGVEFPETTIRLIESNEALLSFLFYWRSLDDIMK